MTWSFGDLQGGVYEISASWFAWPNRALWTLDTPGFKASMGTDGETAWSRMMAPVARVAGAALVCLRGLLRRGKDWFYPAIGLAVTALVAIHAWFDFSLQMPAVAVTYAAILGVACAQSFSSRS